MVSTLVDLVKITAASTGTGAITLGNPVQGYRGVEALTNGKDYSYSIQDGPAWEFGRGTFLSETRQFIRAPSDSSDGGVAINLKQNAQIAFTALSADLDAGNLPALVDEKVAESTAGMVVAADLASTDDGKGAALVGFTPDETPHGRSVGERLRDNMSARDYGAVGLGVSRAVGDLGFANLAAAQVYYPLATNLADKLAYNPLCLRFSSYAQAIAYYPWLVDLYASNDDGWKYQEQDWAAFQHVLKLTHVYDADSAVYQNRAFDATDGDFAVSRSLMVPVGAAILGRGRSQTKGQRGTRFLQTSTCMDVFRFDVLVDPANGQGFWFGTMRDFHVYGYSGVGASGRADSTGIALYTADGTPVALQNNSHFADITVRGVKGHGYDFARGALPAVLDRLEAVFCTGYGLIWRSRADGVAISGFSADGNGSGAMLIDSLGSDSSLLIENPKFEAHYSYDFPTTGNYQANPIRIKNNGDGAQITVIAPNSIRAITNPTPNAITFTGALVAATSATLTSAFSGATNPNYIITFSDGSTRTVTLTNGSTAVSWTGAVTATASATYADLLGKPGDLIVHEGASVPSVQVIAPAIRVRNTDNPADADPRLFYSADLGIAIPTTPFTGLLTFTAALTAATSATLTSNFTGTTGAYYRIAFSDGSVRVATLTNGSTAVTWTGGAVTATANATYRDPTTPGLSGFALTKRDEVVCAGGNDVHRVFGTLGKKIEQSLTFPSDQLSGTSPGRWLYETDGPTNAQSWVEFANSGALETRVRKSDGTLTQVEKIVVNASDKPEKQLSRLTLTLGTTLTTGDFTVGGGWGTGATLAIVSASKDGRFTVDITAGASGLVANPALTLTFKDGAFAATPIPLAVGWNSTDNTGVDLKATASTTQVFINLLGTPLASKTYRITCHVL
ncbi:hypothetical protein [Novosphingobium colocasiae]|uniref:hypothetical protein n=1 Tax=Novosphingobium colocasiae TaxID=1256513 RepID=UPI0035B4E36D